MRTPLNAVTGWVGILQHQDAGARRFQEGLKVIERNTRAQVQLIDDLLDMSRILRSFERSHEDNHRDVEPSDADTAETVPWTGPEFITRAYAKIVDSVNGLDLEDLQRAQAVCPTSGR